MNVGTTTGHFGVTTRITRVGFGDGWTGVVAICTIAYVLGAILFTVADLPSSVKRKSPRDVATTHGRRSKV